MSLCITLYSCGFRPLYKPPAAGSVAGAESIRIEPIADRTGQILRNNLLDRLNPKGTPLAPRFSLGVKLTESINKLALRKDEVATRANLTLRATYSLVRLGDGKKVAGGSVESIVSYNILGEDFATISSANNARGRGVRDLSNELHVRVSLVMARERTARTPEKTPDKPPDKK